MDDEVREFIRAYLVFYDTVLSNVGYDQGQFEAAEQRLLALKTGAQAAGVIPIKLANVFVDMYSAIESASYRHDPELAQTIRHAAEALAAAAREVTFTTDDYYG